MSRHPLTWVPGDAVYGMLQRGYKVLRIETREGHTSSKIFQAMSDYPPMYREAARLELKKMFVLMHKGGQSEIHKILVRK